MLAGVVFTSTLKASSPKVEYLGQARYGDYIVGKFRVNGEIAFCLDHAKVSPPTGTSYGEVMLIRMNRLGQFFIMGTVE